MRFRGLEARPPVALRSEPFGYAIGDLEEFFVVDLLGEPRIRTVTAIVRAITEHAYFFVEEEFPVPQETLSRIGDDFEALVYPTVRSAFGSEPTPGVDADERMTLLHANLQGAGGYFSGSDRYSREVVPYSNEREMLYLEANVLYSPGIAYNGLLAHEFQHMIHANADFGEDSWVNEGLSQVAAELVGAGSDWLALFLDEPDTGLIDWPEIGSSAVHYAASELFFSYLLDQYGSPQNANALLEKQKDSVSGVRNYLDDYRVEFGDVFADWVVANYLDEDAGKYSHPNTETSIEPGTTATAGKDGEGDVSQFAADYIEVAGGTTFSFDGADEVSIGVPEHDGAFYWSQRGDAIDSRMTAELDLTDVDSATLRFDAWFAIEPGWDYAYVAASADGGETWEALAGRETTDYDPVGNSYGPGYTGESQGWVNEEIDLSGYAGDTVLIRFEYVTDESTNRTGFAVDNIAVAETGFADDGSGGSRFVSEGFVRVDGPLEQSWIVQVVDLDSRRTLRMGLDGENRGTALIGRRSVIAISAVTERTSEKAAYAWAVGE